MIVILGDIFKVLMWVRVVDGVDCVGCICLFGISLSYVHGTRLNTGLVQGMSLCVYVYGIKDAADGANMEKMSCRGSIERR